MDDARKPAPRPADKPERRIGPAERRTTRRGGRRATDRIEPPRPRDPWARR